MAEKTQIVLEDSHFYLAVTPPGGLRDHGASCCLEIGSVDSDDEDEGGSTLLPVSEDGIRSLIAHLERYLPDGDNGASQH